MGNKKIIMILTIFSIIFCSIGASLAYLNWESDNTLVTFVIDEAFTCSANVGGSITPENVSLAPAVCTHEKNAIKKELIVYPTIFGDLTIGMDLWLEIKSIAPELSATENFKYALTTDEYSCTNNVISSGSFTGKQVDDKIDLLKQKIYHESIYEGEVYWLYIWLDAEETSLDTANKSFNFVLNGTCKDYFDDYTWTISFDANGGNEIDTTISVPNGSTYGTLPVPTRDGYNFVGWNTQPDGQGVNITSDTVVNLNDYQTLYAIWTEIGNYNISYDACGGLNAPETQTKQGGVTLTLSSLMPTKTGYTFVGWSTASSCSAATSKNYDAGGSYTVDANDTLYAVWRENVVYIKYNTNGGTIKSTTTYNNVTYTWASDANGLISRTSNGTTSNTFFEVPYDSTDNLPNPDGSYMTVTKDYYSVTSGAEWKCMSGSCVSQTYNDTTNYTANQFCNIDNGDCTIELGVNWSVDTYTISYDANGGTGAPSNQNKQGGVALTLSSAKPTWTGHTFLGWSESSTATTATYASGGSFENDSNATLYAVWRENVVYIKYNTNGGTIKSTTTYNNVTYTWASDANGLISRTSNGTTSNTFFEVPYDSTDNLPNPDGSYMTVTRDYYSVTSGAEWKCMSGSCVSQTYNDTTNYAATDYCNIDNGDCTIELGVNWTPNKVYVKFKVDGGSITTPVTDDDGVTVWNWSTDSNGIVFRQKNSDSTTNTDSFFTINYGSTRDLPNYNYSKYLYITKTGYSAPDGSEWICTSGCTTANKTFDQDVAYNVSDFCDTKTGNCTATVKVNWQPNPYTVSYNSCGGTPTPSNQTKYYGQTLTLTTTVPTKTGYTFLGWSTASSCAAATSATYSFGGNYTTNAADTLYAVWERVYVDQWVDGKSGSYEFNASSHYNWSTNVKMRVSWLETYNEYKNASKVSITNLELYYNGAIATMYVGGSSSETKGISINGTMVQALSHYTGGTYFPSGTSCQSWCTLYKQVKAFPWTSGEIAHNTNGELTVPILVDVRVTKDDSAYYANFLNTTNITLTDLR